MGKKRTRNTAKTGDKALYKSRNVASALTSNNHDSDDDDAMYSKVDKFYNQRDEQDFIELTKGGEGGDSDDDDDELLQQEAVMDLGGGDVSSSDDEDDKQEEEDESSDEDDEPNHTLGNQKTAPMMDDEDSSSSESDHDENEDNVRDWGKKKSVYYHGDAAGLENEQDQDDAFVEEEAAREVQAARMKEMSEKDFILSDEEEEDEGGDEDGHDVRGDASGQAAPKKSKAMIVASTNQRREASKKWSKKEQRTFLQQHHPEFLPLVNHFRDFVQDFDQCTNVAVKALYESKADSGVDTAKNVGATKEGERYLLSRALVQSSACLNLAVYMLLKSEYASQQQQQSTNSGGLGNDNVMNSHPVLDHLQKLNSMAEKMEETVTQSASDNSRPLQQQLDHLVKAYALMAEEGQDGNDDDDDSSDDELVKSSGKKDNSKEAEDNVVEDEDMDSKPASAAALPEEASSSSSDDDSEEDEVVAKAKQEAALMNEARFALRLNEVEDESKSRSKKRRRRAAPDFGESRTALDDAANQASHSLANTVNSLEQRFAHTKKAAKKNAGVADHLDDLPENDDDAVRRGLELMEAELGKASDDDDGDIGGDGKDGFDFDDDDDDNEFYNQVKKASQSKKKRRKEQYAVAPKFPRVEEDVEGERAVSRTILKNRGLVPHKNKLNRNPRVKKREQYRKALIRRKGAVRAMRDPQEGQAYGGEETGIKSGVRRSRNLS